MVTKGPALSPADPRVAKAAVLWKSALRGVGDLLNLLLRREGDLL